MIRSAMSEGSVGSSCGCEVLEALGARPAVRHPGVRMDRRRQHRLPPGADQIDDALAGDVPALRLLDVGTVIEQRLAARADLSHRRRRQELVSAARIAGSSLSMSIPMRP